MRQAGVFALTFRNIQLIINASMGISPLPGYRALQGNPLLGDTFHPFIGIILNFIS